MSRRRSAESWFPSPSIAVQYKKGPYFAEEGDFASAGAVNVNYVSLLDKPLAAGGNLELDLGPFLGGAPTK